MPFDHILFRVSLLIAWYDRRDQNVWCTEIFFARTVSFIVRLIYGISFQKVIFEIMSIFDLGASSRIFGNRVYQGLKTGST